MRKVFQGGICSVALKAVEGIKRDKNVKLILDLVEWWISVPWTAFRWEMNTFHLPRDRRDKSRQGQFINLVIERELSSSFFLTKCQ